MNLEVGQKWRRSLFFKILFLFVLAHLAITSVAIVTNQTLFRRARFPKIVRNGVNYSRYVVEDLGTPPDTTRARELADSLGIQIRFEGDGLSWASHEGMIDFNELTIPEYARDSQIHAGFERGKGEIVEIAGENWRYLLVLESGREGLSQAAALSDLIILAFTTIVIVGVYFVIRWMLKPIRTLHRGVEQLSKGNLDYELQTDRIDELGVLVNSFNSMTRRIREMIQARERLLLDVSHELRSPLTRAKVALEFLEDGTAKRSIHDDIMEMETMITELLESQRLKSEYGGLSLQRTNVSALLKEVCDGFRNQKPGVRLQSLPDELYLTVDPVRTEILLKNVVSNALKYSSDDGPPVEISVRETVDEAVLIIRDYGSGIPEEDLPHIFEPFYRVDKSRSKESGGYGLGMSMSKEIMEAHGGSIEISSTLNEGTAVYLRFRK